MKGAEQGQDGRIDGEPPRSLRLGRLSVPVAVEAPVDMGDAMIKVYVVTERQGAQFARCLLYTSPSPRD